MIDRNLLQILVCPETHARLEMADAAIVEGLNRGIAQGAVKNRAGQPVRARLDGGLVRQDKKLLYPIIDGIPVMLVDEAIPLGQIL